MCPPTCQVNFTLKQTKWFHYSLNHGANNIKAIFSACVADMGPSTFEST